MNSPTPVPLRVSTAAFSLLELMVVIGILSVLLVAVIPAVNSLSKSGGRKAAVSNLLGAIEQARSLAIKNGRATYVVFPDALPASADSVATQKYVNRSYAIFEEDPANAGTPKQVTNWQTLPTGISLRGGSLNYLANTISFPFTPVSSTASAPFPFLKFSAQGEVDPSTTRSAADTTGSIQFGIFEGSVEGGADRDTSAGKFSESIEVARLTGRAIRK